MVLQVASNAPVSFHIVSRAALVDIDHSQHHACTGGWASPSSEVNKAG